MRWKWHRVACVYENKDHHPVNLSKLLGCMASGSMI